MAKMTFCDFWGCHRFRISSWVSWTTHHWDPLWGNKQSCYEKFKAHKGHVWIFQSKDSPKILVDSHHWSPALNWWPIGHMQPSLSLWMTSASAQHCIRVLRQNQLGMPSQQQESWKNNKLGCFQVWRQFVKQQ